jgi:bacterioferritin
MLRFDLENERQTILNYQQRIRQADAMGEFALGEVLRGIICWIWLMHWELTYQR